MARKRRRKLSYEQTYERMFSEPIHPEWLDGRVPAGFWKEIDNHRRYVIWLGQQLGFRKIEDWYQVVQNDFKSHGGASLLKLYHGSPSELLMSVFPAFDWKPWLFQKTPQGFWQRKENQLAYLHWLGEQLGIRKLEDWYQVRQRDFTSRGGSRLLDQYHQSPSELLMAAFPTFDWKPWLFQKAPNGFWQQKENRLAYLRWLGDQLGYHGPEDWYAITAEDFSRHQGEGILLRAYKASPLRALRELYPDYDWKPWLLKQVSAGFWNKPENRRRYLQWLGEQLGYRKLEDWYQVQQSDFSSHGGFGLLDHYHSSPSQILTAVFPTFDWKPWLFQKAPQGFWSRKENRLAYLRWLGEQLGYRCPEDWYAISIQDFRNHRGIGIFSNAYRGSPLEALREIYPDYDWKPWLLKQVPHGFWDQSENHRRYLQWLGEKLGFQEPEEWYQIQEAHLYHNHGHILLKRFKSSTWALLKATFPEYPWQPWKFNSIPRGYWDAPTHRRQYLKWLGEQLNFQEPEDWYQLRRKHFEEHRGRHLFVAYYGSSVVKAARELYPHFPWDEERFR